jgi:hypothetical protein
MLPEPALGCEQQDLRVLSASISRFLDNYNTNRRAEAVAIIDELRTYEFDPRLLAKRDQVVEALERNPHMPDGIEWVSCE